MSVIMYIGKGNMCFCQYFLVLLCLSSMLTIFWFSEAQGFALRALPAAKIICLAQVKVSKRLFWKISCRFFPTVSPWSQLVDMEIESHWYKTINLFSISMRFATMHIGHYRIPVGAHGQISLIAHSKTPWHVMLDVKMWWFSQIDTHVSYQLHPLALPAGSNSYLRVT